MINYIPVNSFHIYNSYKNCGFNVDSSYSFIHLIIIYFKSIPLLLSFMYNPIIINQHHTVCRLIHKSWQCRLKGTSIREDYICRSNRLTHNVLFLKVVQVLTQKENRKYPPAPTPMPPPYPSFLPFPGVHLNFGRNQQSVSLMISCTTLDSTTGCVGCQQSVCATVLEDRRD